MAAPRRAGGRPHPPRGQAVPVYHPSSIKRVRATKAQVDERRDALLAIIDDGKPMTVRQVFYQATVRGLVEKAETGYAKVQTDLTVMRRRLLRRAMAREGRARRRRLSSHLDVRRAAHGGARLRQPLIPV
jgi:hypothetical protein